MKLIFKNDNICVTGGARSSNSYGDNLVSTCEVLDLETREIIYGGDLQGPDSHLQMVTIGMDHALLAFASPAAVAQEDLVEWQPEYLTWNQNFPVGSGDTWPARFGATVVSMKMMCPAESK